MLFVIFSAVHVIAINQRRYTGSITLIRSVIHVSKRIYVYHAFCISNCRYVGISKPLQKIHQLLIEFWSSGLVSYYNTSSGVWRAILKSSFNFLARQLSCKSLVIYLLCIIPLVVGLAVSYLPYVPVCPSLLPPSSRQLWLISGGVEDDPVPGRRDLTLSVTNSDLSLLTLTEQLSITKLTLFMLENFC